MSIKGMNLTNGAKVMGGAPFAGHAQCSTDKEAGLEGVMGSEHR